MTRKAANIRIAENAQNNAVLNSIMDQKILQRILQNRIRRSRRPDPEYENQRSVSTISGIGCTSSGDFIFIAIPHRQQHFLGVVKVTAFFAVVLQDVGLDNRIDRTRLFAETAEDAF